MKALLVLSFALPLAMVFSVGLGEIFIHPREVFQALLSRETAPPHVQTILWDLRLPRTVLGMLVGAALAVAGTVTQAIMRNPLAEPGILGINSGAALVAVTLIVGNTSISSALLPWCSFAGALAMSAAIYTLAWQHGTNSLRIILIGIGLGALASALTTFISTFGDISTLQRLMVWLMGSLQDSRWVKSSVLGAWLAPPFALIWMLSRELDLIGFGDSVASSLGQNVDRTRGMLIMAVAAIAGAAVSAAGIVAFVGLAAPHMARFLVGQRHRILLPASALVGALLVVVADLFARRAFAPVQLPVGLMTAMLGTPFFVWFFWKKRND